MQNLNLQLIFQKHFRRILPDLKVDSDTVYVFNDFNTKKGEKCSYYKHTGNFLSN